MATSQGYSLIAIKETVSKELVQETDSRLKREEQKQEHELREKAAAARHQRQLEIILVVTLTIFSLTVGCLCIYVSLSNRFQKDEKDWARSIFQNLLVAIVSFITGKSLNKNSAPT